MIISAGALLKDNVQGNVLAQLKMLNISPKTIIAVKVEITPLDIANNQLGDSFVYDYLDIEVARDTEFAQKTPIYLPNLSTRAFSVKVIEVFFSDRTSWSNEGEVWIPMPDLFAISDPELLKQYRIHFGEKALVKPVEYKDIWVCTCGTVNLQKEPKCHVCWTALSDLLLYNEGKLIEERDQRLAEEKAEQERKIAEEKAEQERIIAEEKAKLEAKKAEEEARKRKIKEKLPKIKKLSIIILSILVVCVVAVVLLVNVIIPAADRSKAYNNAVALYESGDYDGAIAAFKDLGDYKDCEEKVLEATYQKAETLFLNGDYDGAIAAFKDLGDYKDCEEKVLEATYQKAETLFLNGDYKGAEQIYLQLEGYKDSSEKVKAAQEAYTEDRYQTAIKRLERGEVSNAYAVFKELGNYKDSADYLNHIFYVPWNVQNAETNTDYKIVYDENNMIASIAAGDRGNCSEFKYDDNGRVVSFNTSNKMYETTLSYEYDDEGNASVVVISKSTNSTIEYHYSLDKYGNLLFSEKNEFDKDGKLRYSYQHTYENEVDEYGFLLKTKKDKKDTETYKNFFNTYESFGEVITSIESSKYRDGAKLIRVYYDYLYSPDSEIDYLQIIENLKRMFVFQIQP